MGAVVKDARPICRGCGHEKAYHRAGVCGYAASSSIRPCSCTMFVAPKSRRRRVGRPADMTNEVTLAMRLPHGARARYVIGCRCDLCREANNAYERMRAKLRRAGEWNGLVDAHRARRHLEKLSAAGVGRRSVADVAGIPQSSLSAIKRGEKRFIRAETEKKILAVSRDVQNDATLVDAGPTWKRIAWLLEQGFTRQEIARRLGSTSKAPALQLKTDRITARNALAVEKLYRSLQ